MPAGYTETVTVHSVNIVFFLSATEELFYFEFKLFGAHVVDALYQRRTENKGWLVTS